MIRQFKPAALAVALFSAHSAMAAPGGGIEEIIVTAQKREQNLQEVPIAISALPAEALEVNRITTVMDLSSMAPNLSMRSTAGGLGVPNFSMRGAVSYGSVPGSDKPISLYLDGVYIGSTAGSAFELPDIERIEVLRGPQGTLFGRNATAGAISVITRDPLGEFRVHQQLTSGNYDQFRSATRVDFPAWGAVSASLSYTHNERTGDMKNLGVGATWDRNGPDTHQGFGTSPKTLGDENSNSIFASLMYEADKLKAVYKYDSMDRGFTPEGTALVAFTPSAIGPFGDPLAAAYAASPIPLADEHRPSRVNNAWTTPGRQITEGHNLTVSYDINDEMSLKNILSFRRSNIFSNADISGASGLIVDQATADALVNVTNLATGSSFPPGSFNGLIGSPYVGGVGNNRSVLSQKSNELQFTVDKESWTVTTGLYYYEDDAEFGGPEGQPSNIYLAPIPGYVVPTGQRNISFNEAESLAVYAQVEISVSDQMDLLAGYRFTKDEKSGDAYTFANQQQFKTSFDYDNSKPSYMLGVNYHLTPEILLFGKYSTAFVSGGSVGGLDFPEESVKSWEAGLKGDFLDRRLRANIAVFKADYTDVQSVSNGALLTPARPELASIIVPEGDLDTQGVEVELTALPLDSVTLTASAGYTDSDFSDINPMIRDPNESHDTARPKWTSNLSAMYETDPLFDTATLMFNVSANYRSEIYTIAQSNLSADYDPILKSDAMWKLNARLALRDIAIAGAKIELALWGKNLTDADNAAFPINWGYLGSSTYERARTYGVDLTIDF